MRLKKLKMIGFKSFGNKTRMEFEPGFTALVGPNGCGKSNVVDAIRWVLGEKSARSLRGEKMEDVIFGGTDDLHALSFSEVTLEFENLNGILPIDGKTVAVTRRLYRDGESEYLLNNNSVRLKEIENLFMDTGVGKNAYSVMEQGKIDLIISTKPEERRYIFEEAAGISRYKQQKKESLKKLQETENNINRVSDIMREINREKEQKRDQARKAQSYREIKEELSKYEITHFVFKIENLKLKSGRAGKELEAMNGKHEDLSKKVSSIDVFIEEKKLKINDIQHELFEKEKKLISIEHSSKSLEEKINNNHDTIKEDNERLLSIKEKIEKRSANIEKIQGHIQNLNNQERGIIEGLNLHEKISTEKLEEKGNIIKSISNSEGKININRGLINDIEQDQINLQNQLREVIEKLITAIEEKKKEMEVEEVKRNHFRNEIYKSLDEMEKVISDLKALLTSPGINESLERIKGSLDLMNIENLKKGFQQFESYEDGFRSILFDKKGIHSQKEDIEKEIQSLQQKKDDLKNEILSLEKFVADNRQLLEKINHDIGKINITITKDRNELIWIEKQKSLLNEQLAEFKNQLQANHTEIQEIERDLDNRNTLGQDLDKNIETTFQAESALKENIRDLVNNRSNLKREADEYESQIADDKKKLSAILPDIQRYEKILLENRVKEEQIRESLYHDYELHLDEAKERTDIKNKEIADLNISEVNRMISELKSSINGLGVINHLALDEYEELKERHLFYDKQFQDMTKARSDIFKLIKDIDKVSTDLFLKAFETIQKSFSKIFRRLFEGGDAQITLTEPDNPLESGIDIIVHPPGKHPKRLSLLSGGEKSLIAISILFATYEIRPSPFCFLDEIDAALDESNIDRFIKLLYQFSEKSQFIIITHNKRTMSMADSIYGVTMEQPGISKLVSMRLDNSQSENKSA